MSYRGMQYDAVSAIQGIDKRRKWKNRNGFKPNVKLCGRTYCWCYHLYGLMYVYFRMVIMPAKWN